VTSTDVTGIVHRATAMRELGRLDRADQMIRDALAQDPTEPTLLLALSRVLGDQQRWDEAIDAAEAALATTDDPAPAHVEIAYAATRTGRWSLVEEHATAVLHESPGEPIALMHLAAAIAHTDRGTEGRERFRSLYREAFARTGGGTPWTTAVAVWLERTAGSAAEAGHLVDAGLERWPTDRWLLGQKADLAGTTGTQTIEIYESLLADRPDDALIRARYDDAVRRRMLGLHAVLWVVPVVTAVGVVVTDGGWRTLWTVGTLVLLALWGSAAFSIRRKLPEPVLHARDAPGLRRSATRWGRRLAVACGIAGTLALGADAAFGAYLLVIALVGWLVVRLVEGLHARHAARADDDQLAPPHPTDETAQESRRAPGTMVAAALRRHRSSAIWVPVKLVPLYVFALWPEATNALDDRTGRGIIGVVAAVVALVAIAEAVGWDRRRPAPYVAWRLVQRGIPAVLLATLLIVSGTQLVAAVSRTAELKRPSSGTERQLTPDSDSDTGVEPDNEEESGGATPGGLMPGPSRPSPTPSIDINFNIPTIPPIVPPEG
jgi:tetratricopeptide (TPR) repeat protein